MRRLSALAGGAALAASACVAAPTPLAPGLHGSIGTPQHGVLVGGAPLPKSGTGYRLLRANGVAWGHPRLVASIQRAAAAVATARPGGAPLLVGDLSARSGGAASGHRSHRSGRDADLLFYAVTPSGRSVPSPGFARFGPDGLAKVGRNFVRLDVEREWLLVRALTTDPDAHVEWMFVARWLEALLVEHALARGEDLEVILRAESMMQQPSDSLAHDDHLHLRIACTPADAVGGCAGKGPAWPWLPRPDVAPAPDDAALLADLLGP